MNGKKRSAISRREFARRAALASAASLVAASVLPPEAGADTAPSAAPQNQPALSAESQAEAEGRFQLIVATYSTRFNEDQKKELKRLCFVAQSPFDRLRASTVENGDAPALYLKPLVEREKKPSAPVNNATQPATKKP